MLFPAFWNLLKQTTVNRVFTIPQIVKFSSYAYISANCWDRWWSKGIYSLLEFIQTKDEKSLLAKKRNLFQTLVWVEVRDESQHTQLSCSLKVWTDAAIIGMRRNGMNEKKSTKLSTFNAVSEKPVFPFRLGMTFQASSLATFGGERRESVAAISIGNNNSNIDHFRWFLYI